jgi:glutamine---fructose-6-phosphate transaminase (isomerizing)
VASTKAFTCQLTVLAILALKAARTAAGSSDDKLAELAALRTLPGQMAQALTADDEIRDIAYGLSESATCSSSGAGRCIPWRWKAR